MQGQIKVKNRKIRYVVRVSRQARRMRLDAYYDGRFILTVPKGIHESMGKRFIREKAEWMLEQLKFFKQFEGGVFFRNDEKTYRKHKERAAKFIHNRVAYYNTIYPFRYNAIRVKNHKSVWGSCSEKRNLNFNYKLIFLPRKVADYIIVHELCHLKEFNHSPRFWNQVAKTFPDYRRIEGQLKQRY